MKAKFKTTQYKQYIYFQKKIFTTILNCSGVESCMFKSRRQLSPLLEALVVGAHVSDKERARREGETAGETSQAARHGVVRQDVVLQKRRKGKTEAEKNSAKYYTQN
jgi:hypothetical protein